MKLTTKIAAGAIAAAALATAGLSWAHPGGMGYGMGYGMGPGWGHRMGPGWGPGMGPGMGAWATAADAEAAVAGQLAALKTELKVTAAQERAWAGFEQQAKEQVTSQQALHKAVQEQMHGPQAGDKTAADFTALHESMFKLRQANAEKRAAALKDLYAVLTPEQKAVAERRFGGQAYGWGPGGGMGMGRGWGPGRGGGWGPGGCGAVN